MHRTLLASLFVTAMAGSAAADTPSTPPPSPQPQANGQAQPAPAPPAEVQIEITDATASGAAPVAPSFVGALAISVGDCGSVEAGNATGHYEVRICFDNRGGTAPADTLSVEVERTIHGHAELHQKVKTTAHVSLGKRVVLGRFGTGGDSTEIAATVK